MFTCLIDVLAIAYMVPYSNYTESYLHKPMPKRVCLSVMSYKAHLSVFIATYCNHINMCKNCPQILWHLLMPVHKNPAVWQQYIHHKHLPQAERKLHSRKLHDSGRANSRAGSQNGGLQESLSWWFMDLSHVRGWAFLILFLHISSFILPYMYTNSLVEYDFLCMS